ncbi:MAG: DUF2339 domain-containing protein [Terricaulis sp.]
METLFLFALLGLSVWQSARVGALKRELATLQQRLGRLEQGSASKPATAPTFPAAADIAPAPGSFAPTPATPESEEPLLLDNPIPAASNDEGEGLPFKTAPLRRLESEPSPSGAKAQGGKAQGGKAFEKWLAENGLAWLAGGALALGVIFLVALAAREGWLTAQVRLGLALALGAALIGAGERLRRIGIARPPGHPLAGAMCAGAGMVAFYAVSWAACGLYGFIGWPLAATLLALCALALIGLSFLHGQALGALALMAAFLAPPLTNIAVWPDSALTLYVCAVGTTGFALAWARRWAWSAAAAFLGLYFWFAASIAADQAWRALALLCFASVGGVVMTARASTSEQAEDWRLTQALAPTIGVCVSSILLLWTWLAIAPAPDSRAFGPALIGVFHAALAAYAVRGRAAHGGVFFVAASALAAGMYVYAVTHAQFSLTASAPYAWALLAAAASAIAALGAKPHRAERTLVAIAGAGAATSLTALTAFTRTDWHGFAAWGPLFIGAIGLFACAVRTGRETVDPTEDGATDAWAAGGAILLLLGIESAFREPLSIAACAGAAFVLAALFTRRGWRVLRVAAPSAAILALAHGFSSAVWTQALANPGMLARALLWLALSAVLLFAASRAAARRDQRNGAMAEALSSAGALALIAGMFLTLSFFASGGDGAPLDALTASALRALTLLAAGYVLMPTKQNQHGPIATWRAHILLASGLAWALVNHGFVLNPWWGGAPASIAGPPLFNVQALAYAAPAALAFAASRRARIPLLARFYAIGVAVLAWLWVTLEIRHAFQGAAMAVPGFAGLEGFAHALWPLALLLGAQKWLAAEENGDLRVATAWVAWPALLWAAWGLWLSFNPWWGAAPAQLDGGFGRLLALAAIGAAAWLSARAPWALDAQASQSFARVGTLACVGHLIVAATLAARMAHHSADLSAAPVNDTELWTYSVTWALFGAAAFWIGARRADALLRWSGLVILLATTAYVAFLAFTRLEDIARVGSLLGLAAVLLAVTWFARTGAAAKSGAA